MSTQPPYGPRYELGPEDPAEAHKHYDRLSPEERVKELVARDGLVRVLQARYEEALRLGRSDELTGILNRKGLIEGYERGAKQRRRLGENAKSDLLVIVDLDDFKSINSARGHPAGDKTLQEVAGILSVSVREGDVVGRYGGDEFIALLYGATIEEGTQVAERMRFNAETFHKQLPSLAIPTLSVGVAEIDYRQPFDTAVKAADDTMYVAKNGGKNQVQVREAV